MTSNELDSDEEDITPPSNDDGNYDYNSDSDDDDYNKLNDTDDSNKGCAGSAHSILDPSSNSSGLLHSCQSFQW